LPVKQKLTTELNKYASLYPVLASCFTVALPGEQKYINRNSNCNLVYITCLSIAW